ncbi:MAG: VCBS repeat-containing protein, partial [Planctomycetes bacterium]|nr:VCBS repeat-containing protein [Planctomycetota bacterium]
GHRRHRNRFAESRAAPESPWDPPSSKHAPQRRSRREPHSARDPWRRLLARSSARRRPRSVGFGSLGAAVLFPSGFKAKGGITGGDFDRDGDVDLALASQDTDTARLLDNQGAGTFVLLASAPAGGNPLAITSADFDRDGRADLALLLERASTFDNHANVGVLLNQGSGSFGPSTLYPVGYEPLGFLSADLDRDANPDLVVVANQTRALSLLVNHGDGTFGSRLQVSTGSWPVGVTCGDLDGDGDLDLASTHQVSETVEIHFNRCR